MSVPVHCPFCGLNFPSQGLQMEECTNVTLVDYGETCPRCGRWAKGQDGTYDFVGKVIAALRAPGVMRDDVVALRDVVKAAKAGELSAEDAAQKVAAINSGFAAVWNWANTNSGGISVLLGILMLYLAYLALQSADRGAAQAHQDNQQVIALQQQIYGELKRQRAPAPLPVRQLSPTPPMPTASPPQKRAQETRPNRRERRAARARDRRRSKPNP